MIPGPASATHIQWQLSPRHPSYQSSRESIQMALIAVQDGDEYRGPLGMLDESSLLSLLADIDAQAEARRDKRVERRDDFDSNWSI